MLKIDEAVIKTIKIAFFVELKIFSETYLLKTSRLFGRIKYRSSKTIFHNLSFDTINLATYISIKPKELINVFEKNIVLEQGIIVIPHPKEKKPKLVPLIDEDIELLKSLPRGLPDLPFFRHAIGISRCKAGERFGEKHLYKWWEKACDNLGIIGIDLFGGTRHSSAIALGKYATPEQIRYATMHSTNKAFERYYRIAQKNLGKHIR